MKFPHYLQLDQKDCGPTCLRMIAKYYGKNISIQTLRQKSSISKHGVSLLGIGDAAESIGFKTLGVKLNFNRLLNDATFPCIVHWNQNHFVIVYKITNPYTFNFFNKIVYRDSGSRSRSRNAVVFSQ